MRSPSSKVTVPRPETTTNTSSTSVSRAVPSLISHSPDLGPAHGVEREHGRSRGARDDVVGRKRGVAERSEEDVGAEQARHDGILAPGTMTP